MTFEEISTFLSVVENGSISKASELLCRSQSAISSRLKQLETELGITLLTREKGKRSVELTTQGKIFLPIAQQWIELWRNTSMIKYQSELLNLRIGSIDIVNNYMFVPIYQRIIEKKTNLHLQLFTHHSSEIHNLLYHMSVDIGFVFSQTSYHNIVSKPICKEKMVLICREDSPYRENIMVNSLKEQKEVYLNWGPDFKSWHDQYWDPNLPSYVTINTGSMMANFLQEPENWGIAPISVAKYLKQVSNIRYFNFQQTPPPMVCYELTHRYPTEKHEKAINIFNSFVNSYLSSKENPDLLPF